jgi:hypothetical protein
MRSGKTSVRPGKTSVRSEKIFIYLKMTVKTHSTEYILLIYNGFYLHWLQSGSALPAIKSGRMRPHTKKSLNKHNNIK